MDPLNVSIVILTYNRMDCLRELLTEMKDLLGCVREIVVVDNCSTDGTEQMLRDEFGSFSTLRTNSNVGVSARNFGIAQALGDVVVTIDDDIMGLSAKDLCHIQERFRADSQLAGLNFQVRDWFSRKTCNWVHHRSISDAELRFDTYEITEGAVAFRREAVLQAGGYYEAYFISHEGPDLAFRLMNRGYGVQYDGAVVVYHKHEQRSREPWRFYYFDTRNLVWLAVRNLPWPDAATYLARSLSAMMIYSLRDGYFVWWAKAIRDGTQKLPEMLRGREPWHPVTRQTCREIDSHRPSFWSQVWKRLTQPANRLDG